MTDLEPFYAKHLGLYITQECLENPDVPPMIYCRASHCVWQDGKWVPLEQMPAAQDPDTRFHTGHLEEFPELTGWLCKCFDDFYDANLSHNDLIELTLNHLQRESLKPEFFISLAENAPAVCMGTKKIWRSAD